jgi:hypothetical protein
LSASGRLPREGPRDLLSGTFDYVASAGNTAFLANNLELSATITAELGDPLPAAQLAGAAEPSGRLRTDLEAARTERCLTPARVIVTPEAWAAELATGQALTEDEAIRLLVAGM